MCRAGGRGGEGKTGSFFGESFILFFPVIIYMLLDHMLCNEFIEYILLNVLCSFVQQNVDK